MTKAQVIKKIKEYNQQETGRTYQIQSLLKYAAQQKKNGWYINVTDGRQQKEQYLGETLPEAYNTIETECNYHDNYKSYFSAI